MRCKQLLQKLGRLIYSNLKPEVQLNLKIAWGKIGSIKTRLASLPGIDALKNLFLIFILVTVVLLFIAWRTGFYDDQWVRDVLVEAHGMWFDILILGILATILSLVTERRQTLQRYNEEIEDFLAWQSEEASYRITGNIRRINRLGEAPTTLERAFLAHADLHKANLRHVKLNLANLSDAKLHDAHLNWANLDSANLSNANLRDADLRYADLSNANLSNAILNNANLSAAILSNANLSHADLSNANLIGVNLSEADLGGACLSFADLTGAKGICKEQLAKAELCHTTLLEGIDLDSDRDCPDL